MSTKPETRRYGPGECPECRDHLGFRNTVVGLTLIWLAFLITDQQLDKGQFPDGFAALYSPPLFLGVVISAFYGYVDKRCRNSCGETGVIQNNMHAYSAITLATILLVTTTLFVADVWDGCITDYPAIDRCIPSYSSHQYWSWIPILIAFVVAGVGNMVANLYPKPANVFNAYYWITPLGLLFIAGAVIDCIRVADASPADGWRGLDTAYVQTSQLVMVSLAFGAQLCSAYVAHIYSDAQSDTN